MCPSDVHRCARLTSTVVARLTSTVGTPLGILAQQGATLAELSALVEARATLRPEGSYTTKLFEGGVRRIAQKVGEEGVETALASVAQDDDALLGEAADLVFHLLVLLRARGLGLEDVEAKLRTRRR